jgi:ribosomal protein S12 methylthiotransferase accessory factor
MDILVNFPGGKRVDAQLGEHVIRTDQPIAGGGEGTAPAPVDLFLASLATCAGFYVLAFCQARGLSTDDLRLRQRTQHDPATKGLSQVTIEVELPAGFPPEYREAVTRAAAACKVKKLLAAPPNIEVVAVLPGQEQSTGAPGASARVA